MSGNGDGVACVPACRLEDLGDASFRTIMAALSTDVGGDGQRHRFGRDRRVDGKERLPGNLWLGRTFFEAVEKAIDRIQSWPGEAIPYGMNLIHSPGEPELEAAVVDLLSAAGGAAGRGVGLSQSDGAGGPLSSGGPPSRRVGEDRRGQSRDRQGFAGRGRSQIHGARRRRKSCELVAAGEVSAEQAEWARGFP